MQQFKEFTSKTTEQVKKAGEQLKKASKQLIRRSLADVVRDYIQASLNNTTDEFVADLSHEIQENANVFKDEDKGVLVQQVIYLNLLGYDTTWADFMILEVMSNNEYSNKRLCYTASGFLWNENSDVVLMATNRVRKDLTTNNTLITSHVLSGVTSYLSVPICQHIANDVISFMSSARADVRQKAITAFYCICLKYPDALRTGFQALKARLDDTDPGVLFATLNVMAEFCRHNASNFTSLIPKLYKMLDNPASNLCLLKLVNLLRMLCDVEPRLPKKLINPFTNILETTSSITVLFEVVRTIIEVPITNTILLTYAAQRMQNFLEHQDANLRFLCLGLFIKLMEIQPKLVAQNKEIITQCLDSNDEVVRLMALDLLIALANSKTIDGIVAKMFQAFKNSLSVSFKNTIVTRIIEICSKNDYALVSDFNWYIQVLLDFIDEGGFTCFEILSNQFMDLATRVPATREALVDAMGHILGMRNYRDATSLLLTCLYIIAEYSQNAALLDIILNENMLYCDERVQMSTLSTAFKLYIRCDTPESFSSAEKLFTERLPQFQSCIYAEVQDLANVTLQLVEIFLELKDSAEFKELKDKLTVEYDEETLPPLEVPEEIAGDVEISFDVADDDDDFLKEDTDGPVDPLVAATAEQLKKVEGYKEVSPEKAKKIKIRKQSKKVDRSNIVIKAAKKPLFGAQPEKKKDALADAFANIDLTEKPQVSEEKPKQKKEEEKLKEKKKPLKMAEPEQKPQVEEVKHKVPGVIKAGKRRLRKTNEEKK